MKLKCLYPECDRYRYGKGLCESHYNMARRLVKKGLATWEGLEKAGKVDLGALRCGPEARWFLEGKKNPIGV